MKQPDSTTGEMKESTIKFGKADLEFDEKPYRSGYNMQAASAVRSTNIRRDSMMEVLRAQLQVATGMSRKGRKRDSSSDSDENDSSVESSDDGSCGVRSYGAS